MSSAQGSSNRFDSADEPKKLTKAQKKNLARSKKREEKRERAAAEPSVIASGPDVSTPPGAPPSHDDEDAGNVEPRSGAGALPTEEVEVAGIDASDEIDIAETGYVRSSGDPNGEEPGASNEQTASLGGEGVNADDCSPRNAEQRHAPTPPHDMSEVPGDYYDARPDDEDEDVDQRLTLQYATRDDWGDTNHTVLTNHFSVELDAIEMPTQDDHCLYEYCITVDQNQSKAKKRVLMEAAFGACAALRRSRDYWVSDNMSKIISWRNLTRFDTSINQTPSADDPVLDTFNITNNNKKDHTSSTLSLQFEFVRKIRLEDLFQYVNGSNNQYDDKQNAVAALNLFLTKYLLGSGNGAFQVGKNRFFLDSAWEDFDSPGKLAYRGYSLQVRPTMGKVLLNSNTATSLFYECCTVAQYLAGRGNRTEDLIGVRVWVKFKRNPVPLQRDAQGNVTDLDTPQARTKTITEFGESADEQFAYSVTATDGTRSELKVWGHMQKYKGHQEDNRNSTGKEKSLCVNTNPTTSSTKAWFLAEDLLILPNQMYKPKLQGPLTSKMIKKACRTPAMNCSAILREGLPAVVGGAVRSNGERPQPFRDLGISINPQMLELPAGILPFPALQFSQGQPTNVEKNDCLMSGQWQLGADIRFLEQTHNVPGAPFFLLPNSYNHQAVPDFIAAFWAYYRRHGAPNIGRLPQMFDDGNSVTRNYWSKQNFATVRNKVRNQRPSIVILMLPRNDKQNLIQYAAFKAIMDQAGLDSMCICEETIVNRFGRHPHTNRGPTSKIANYAYNIGMKLNVRFGNTNHSLAQAHFGVLKGRNADTLILGADVIHPGAASNQFTPSLAALVGSVDEHYAKYFGSMRMQDYDAKAASKEIIGMSQMRAMARERLQAWHKGNGRFPVNILYYRDGVSESQFDKVLADEVRMIAAAYQDVTATTPQAGHEPRITCVVVVKRHNIRLYPASNDSTRMSGTGNCLPGTMVDSGIAHPYNFDFFLISHDGLQGTAKPTHYTILRNDMNFAAQDIQELTHNLCYTYQRSTTSVSYAPPAYYADRLCERGRHYLMDFFDGKEELMNLTDQQIEQRKRDAWGGNVNANPWHHTMNEKMFWM